MEIGWVKDVPVPVLEIVSGADETTEVSVVGKFPDNAVPSPFTAGLDEVGGEVDVDETTAASSVAKCPAAAGAGEWEERAPSRSSVGVDAAEGVPSICGDDEDALPLAFAA